LRADARRHDDAIWLLRRAIRRWPSEAANYFILGNIYWDQRRFDEALELYRFAACLSEREEQFASSYFSAATFCQQTEAVLAFLRNRFQRFGRRSSLPARTLFSAYMQLDRIHEALAVVEEALRLRPDDGELRLFAADAYVACSTEHTPRALELLEQAKPNAPEVAWRRTAARLASTDGRLNDALVHWQRILELQPLAVDAHRAVTQLLAETQGSAAALAHLQQATDRFPHHHPVHELWIQWLRDEPSEVREPVIRRVVEMNPDDAWVRRELALVLADQKRFDEAWEQVHCAGQLEPTNPSYHTVRSYLLRCQGQIAEARQALRAAIELSVDDDFAIGELIGLCDTLEERREALTFVKDQLVRQVIFGDGLLAFQMHARDTLEPGELLHELREALAARPDLWHGWSAVVGQLLDMDQVDEAWQLVVQATERFPLLPRLWLDRAVVCRARGQPAAEREALETAYRINPSWGTAVRALSDLYERCGEYDRARELLEHAVGRNPLDVVNHVLLAEALWRLGQREAALERVHHAVQIEPGYDRAWSCLNEWSEALGCPERAMQTAREITQRRGGEARSWLILARLLDAPDQLDERLAALAKAIELNPRCDDAYDVQAVSLALAGRWDEALASCRPAAWGDRPPPSLQVRAAWIEAQRGDLDTAIARLREIVQAEPQYVEAWSLLADWYAQRGDQEQYLEIAETLVRLRPQSEIAWGYLGEARLVQGDRDAAREAFRRALELNPTYEFAGNNLFDLQLEDGELDGAAQTLALVQTHSNGPFVVARETRLAAKRGYRDEACDALKRVCLLPSESNWPVAVAVDAVAESWSPGVAEQILEERIFADGAHPEVGVQWIKLRTGRKDWGAGARLCELLERGEIGRQATYAYIDALRRAGARRLLLRFVGQNRTWLRQQTFTWGAVGFGLAGIRAYREAAEWHADWASREGAEPWMLVNAIEGLRALGRDEEAAEASRAALALPPGYGQHLHHLWLAADEILGDNLPAARQHLDQAKTDKLDDDWQFQLALVEALVEMAEAPPAEAGPVFRSVRRKVARARAGYKAWTHEPARRRLYRRVLAKIARQRGTFAARLWHWLRWIQSF
jgi:tetratricopeptide (TPR) repeat protein